MHCTIEGMDILFSDYCRITQHNHMLNATAIKNHLPYQKLSNGSSTIKGPSPFLMRLQFHACWIACRWQISNDSTTWWVTMASTRGRGFWFRSATQKSLWAAPATSRWTITPRERLQSFTLRDAQVAKLNPWQALLLQRWSKRILESVRRSLQVDDGTAAYYLSVTEGDPRAAMMEYSEDLRWEQLRAGRYIQINGIC